MKNKINEVLNKVRPILQRDGGDVELVGYSDEGVVSVNLQGACGSCPGATYTLKMVIEEQLKKAIPEVKEVIQANQ